MEKFTVKVTDVHITNGVCEAVAECPIALAIKAHGFQDVMVEEDYIRIENQKFRVPYIATKFIQQFDRKFQVDPIEFDLVPWVDEEEEMD